jgi:hypothetical protein
MAIRDVPRKKNQPTPGGRRSPAPDRQADKSTAMSGSDFGMAADPGQLISSLPSGAAQRTAMLLQRQTGNASLNRALVQRQPAPVPPANPPAEAPATPESVQAERDAREKTARDALAARTGQPGVKIWFNNPKSTTFTAEDTETLNLGEVVPRYGAEPARLAFDQAGPATAYASLQSGKGAVVVQEGGFYFVLRLAPGKHDFTSGSVYQVETQGPGVVTSISGNGYNFPTGSYEPDPSRAELKGRDRSAIDEKENRDTSTGQATVPSAKDLRALAGINLDTGKPGQPGDKDQIKPDNSVAVTTEQGEAFIRNYMQARALETLDQNESMAYSLEGTFKPDASKEGPNKSSASAQTMIDSARQISVQYREILNKERTLEEEANKLETTKSKETAGYFMEYERNGKKERKNILDWISDVKADQAKITSQKAEIISSSPLVGQMIEQQAPRSDLGVDVSHAASAAWGVATAVNPVAWLADKAYKKVSGPDNPVDRSPLGQPQTPAGDEGIRADFLHRLDAVLKAIHKTRARSAAGDVGFLFGLEGLQARVNSDLSGLKGRNEFLSAVFGRMRNEHQARQEKEEYVEGGIQIVVQIGALFFPPLQFVSAALGFALQAKQMNEHLNEWEASQASVDPNKAMADQQKVVEKLTSDTFWMAVQAVDLATSANATLHGSETSGKTAFTPPKPLAAAEREAESAKVLGRAATATGEIKVTQGGYIFACHSPCEELRQEFAALFAENGELNNRMLELEGRAGRAATGTDEAAKKAMADVVAVEAAQFRIVLAQAKADMERMEKAMAELLTRSPALQATGLDAAALRRTLAKGSNPNSIKGYLQEELYSHKIAGLSQEELAKMAPKNVQETVLQGKKLEFIEGRRLSLNGDAISDGIIGYYNEQGEFVIVNIIESKAGRSARKGLASHYESATPKKVKLPDGTEKMVNMEDYVEMQNEIASELLDKYPKELKGMKLEDVKLKYGMEIEYRMGQEFSQSQEGQVRRDLERLIEADNGKPTELTLDNSARIKVRAYPSSTKVTAVYPKDIPTGRLEKNISKQINVGLKADQAGDLPFQVSVDKTNYSQKDLEAMAEEIKQAADAAKAPAVAAP